ncbi:MAG: Spermidine/putrescine import ATP-binding protein PotA [Clostridium sp.]
MGDSMNNIIEIKDVEKIFGDNVVIKKINLNVKEGEFLTILGPSGCGKTTTLRMIAGFESVTSGSILISGENVENKKPYQRNVNTVFQNYALFPHMNVYDNVAFGLVEKKIKKSEIKERVNQMLSLVQLNGFEKKMPAQMSGGQKQRVAIARALINRPKVLLLDEPLGALDLKLRKQMQIELKHLQRKLGTTFIYVTHDQEEALTMSDRIVVMNEGNIEQVGTPDEIYENPKSKFVAEFIGESNIFEANIEKIQGDKLTAVLESGTVTIYGSNMTLEEMIYISVRPEKIKCSFNPVEGFTLKGYVKEHIYVGSIIKTIIELPNGHRIKMNSMSGTKLIDIDKLVYIYWDRNDAVIMRTKEEQIYNIIENVPKIKEMGL